MGENGAGKSTLMKILYGVQPPDSGTIEINGEQVALWLTGRRDRAGVGMVFQHFMLADNLTVLENVVLGAEKLHGIGDAARAEIRGSPTPTGSASSPTAWSRTSASAPASASRSSRCSTAARGSSSSTSRPPCWCRRRSTSCSTTCASSRPRASAVIFISHKLDEVLSVADEVTVIRRGTTVDTVDAERRHRAPAGRADGRLRAAPPEHRDVHRHRRRSLLSVDDLDLPSADGRPLLDDISFDIHRGEVLGIAGVEGNGQAELVEAIMGMRPEATGPVELAGQRHHPLSHPRSPRGRHRLHPRGPAPPRPAARRPAVGEPRPRPPDPAAQRQRPLIDRRGARKDTERIIEEYDVRTPGIDILARALSGGNQQKLIVGREMSGEPILLIAAHPTRGVDVGAQAAIWDHIKRARREGSAVLLISADLDELIGLSDTIEVILRGRLVGTFDPQRRDARSSSARP